MSELTRRQQPLPPKIAAILKLSGQKVRQHYVFREYLRPWSSGEQIASLRDGNAKTVGIGDVAVQRYFYELRRLTEGDVMLIKNTLLATANEYVLKIADSLIQCFTLPHAVQDLLESKYDLQPEVSQWIQEQIVNGEENYHCVIEHVVMRAVYAMLAGNTDFYSDPKACYEFLYGLCVQYFRTKRIRASIAKVKTPHADADMNRVTGLFTLISALKVADSLFQERQEHKIVVLVNQTPVPFITGDQPIINLHATHGQGVPEELELYYPLSPTRAMAFVRLGTDVARFPDEGRVDTLNELIVRNSREWVFSSSVTQLKALASVVESMRRSPL